MVVLPEQRGPITRSFTESVLRVHTVDVLARKRVPHRAQIRQKSLRARAGKAMYVYPAR